MGIYALAVTNGVCIPVSYKKPITDEWVNSLILVPSPVALSH
jgi:hypothetical protein